MHNIKQSIQDTNKVSSYNHLNSFFKSCFLKAGPFHWRSFDGNIKHKTAINKNHKLTSKSISLLISYKNNRKKQISKKDLYCIQKSNENVVQHKLTPNFRYVYINFEPLISILWLFHFTNTHATKYNTKVITNLLSQIKGYNLNLCWLIQGF